jgi:hypothetical protein
MHRLAAALLIFSAALPAQHRSDPRYSYHRVIAVVPFTGSGTPADPIRAKYAPAGQNAAAPGTGIIAFAMEPTDDGKYAVVELVALDRAALAQILADHSPGVLVFEKGVVSNASIEAAIKPLRRDFSLRTFGVVM